MKNYIRIGTGTLIDFIPLTFILFLIFTGIKYLYSFLLKRKIKIKIFNMICEYMWILIVLSILKITGLFRGNFGITSSFDNNIAIDFSFFQEGFSTATLLNIVLFIPYGFLSVIVFEKGRKHWCYGILIGFVFTVIIEFLQTFTGRYVQLDDIVMNTLGTFIGYELCILFIKLYYYKQNRNLNIHKSRSDKI